jgi:mono/diheme cytochrome c family protein
MNAKVILIGLTLTATALVSFNSIQSKPWPVPDKYVKMVNPLKGDAASVADGKALWIKHCQSCHGKAGAGDGTKAAQLDTEMRDFKSAEIQKETDGELFYKTLIGRDEMPSFEKKIPDQEELWSIVNFMRTFK